MKNVLAIHDISCVGRCSLTVALPVISGFGSTCSVLPTALLSTHTGGFTGFTCLDLTDEMRKILDAWEPHSLKFDAVYSGFLASGAQIDLVKDANRRFKASGGITVVDPVMGDYGALYGMFDGAFVKKMAELAPISDVLVPNMTEAALLSGVPFKNGPYEKSYVETLLFALQKLGAKNVVLTGVFFRVGELGAALLSEDGNISYSFAEKIEGDYHGTGDVFGSALTGALMRGEPLPTAVRDAVDFTVGSIKATSPEFDRRYGVDFEKMFSVNK